MSLIAWYPLHKDINDWSGNNNHLNYIQNSGALSFADSGKIGQAYQRTVYNVSDLLRSTNKINLSGEFTICAWINPTAQYNVGTANGVVTNHSHTDNSGAGLTLNCPDGSTAYLSCNTGDGSGRTYHTYYGTTNINNTWAHCVMRYKDGVITLWVNGVIEKTVAYSMYCIDDYIDIFNWSTTYTSSDGYRPTCMVNDVRVYDNALSIKEIKELSLARMCKFTFNNKYSEPTINLYDSCGKTFTESLDFPVTPPVTPFNGGFWTNLQWSGDINVGTVLPGESITFSGYYMPHTTDETITNSYVNSRPNGLQAYWSVNGSGGGSGFLGIVDWNNWHYFEYTKTVTDEHTSFRIEDRGYDYQNEIDAALTSGYWCNIQVEKKIRSTPFCEQSRNGIIYDITNLGSIATIETTDFPTFNDDSALGNGSFHFPHSDAWDSNQYKIQTNFNHMSRQISCSVWARHGDLGSLRSPMLKYDAGEWAGSQPAGGAILLCIETNKFRMHGWGSSDPICTTNTADNEWHHFVWTFDYDTRVMNMYVDGMHEVINFVDTEGVIQPLTDYKWCIGGNNHGYSPTTAYTFDGDIDEVAFYGSVLSPEQVMELYRTKGSIDRNGNIFVNEIVESENYYDALNKELVDETYYHCDTYTQANCTVTRGNGEYHIYRPPNLTRPDDGNTMWGGVRITKQKNLINAYEGKYYILQFDYKGQSSNDIDLPYFCYTVGWSTMGGLTKGAVVTPINPFETGVSSEWKTARYGVFVDKNPIMIATITESTAVAGRSYDIMNEMKIGWNYTDTGELGTDMYIRNFKLYSVDDATYNKSGNITRQSVLNANTISEVGIMDNTILGYWDFTLGIFNDISGNNVITTPTNINGTTPTISGEGCTNIRSSSTAGGYILTDLQLIDGTRNVLTCSAYLKRTSLNGNGTFGSAGDNDCNFNSASDTQMSLYVDGINAFATTPNQTDDYHHMVWAINKTSSTQSNIRLFFDGVKLLDGIYDCTLDNRSHNNNLSWFQDWDGANPTDFWQGTVKEIKLFDRMLSDVEIELEYKRLSKTAQINSDGTVMATQFKEV